MNVRKISLLFAILALLLTVSTAWALVGRAAPAGDAAGQTQAVQAQRLPRNVLLVGWDGANRRRVEEGMARGDMPVLSALAAEGAYVPVEIRGATDTAAGWTQILTGYDPEITGVYSNKQLRPIPGQYTLFERMRAQGLVPAAVISVDHYLLSGMPLVQLPRVRPGTRPGMLDRAITDILAGYGLDFGQLYYEVRDTVDIYVTGFGADPAGMAQTTELLEWYQAQPFFLFVHILAPDHWGHASGEASPEYYAALVGSDRATGALVQKLKDLGLYEDTLVYVTADHGFDEDGQDHSNAPHVFLATNERLSAEVADRADIAPTILEAMGVDTAAIQPPLSGHALPRAVEEGGH